MSDLKIIAVVGPTASGKSALGVYLAQKLGRLPAGRQGEVVSADSRQIYKGLDIGTGKITKKEMRGVLHHLLDVASPKRQFSADDFARLGKEALGKIARKGRVPIVAGGTGFYIDVLLGRVVLPHVPPDPALRAALAKKSLAQLLAQLKRLDPKRASEIDPRNKVRIIRAMEVAKAMRSKKNLEVFLSARPSYQILWLGLNPKDFERRIRARLRARMKQGMIAEARRLHAQGLSYRRMEELGLEYRYLARFLRGTLSKERLEEELAREIRRYAKRQMRWFKRNKDIHWVGGKAEALRLSKAFLSR